MDAAGKLPIVAFANGACLNTPIEFAAFLAEIVSQGYFVVAGGRVGRKFDGEDLSKVVEGHPGQIVTRKLLVDGVDWATRENERSGSPYRQRLDTQRVAYMGQSCGGMQALSASTDPRTTTTIVLNSGRFALGMQVPGRGKFPEYFEWSQLHAPIAFFIGGENDLGIGRDNFKEIQHLPVFLADLPVDHSGAYPGPDMRWVKAVLGWLDWQLKGSAHGKQLFVGEQCGLCVDPDWTVGGQKRLQ
jgi:dienelactone hydrolase